MKKVETIERYYCDICCAQCKHTPEYMMPMRNYIENYVFYKQYDLCHDCRDGIATLLYALKGKKIRNIGCDVRRPGIILDEQPILEIEYERVDT